ncbi:prefoldin [Capsaspora owczarzaki ATCC 30864]|uniref:Prefoldin n=1 Tax=Capsaspora owczarzaki (strain ATCC 30864) TaxID=595528 RepID=A0A0D2VGN5_CAPO3|nr:prefoldin [Capsaspora owczarzaki ATCC 30864]KJE89037.1 prefoldin [Capsaspora owczarzaki ATCC 30864]|eukprot:XP_004365467.2 prefoldin [Capsaspora owczarzaki ATCC 30864]
MAQAPATSSNGKPIPSQEEMSLLAMPLGQLQTFAKQMDEEVRFLIQSLSQLHQAVKRFEESRDSLAQLGDAKEGSDLLVPLTSSLYVPGTLANAGKVMVDIGADYYVERSVKDASAFFSRRIAFLMDNIEKLQKTIGTKRANLNSLQDIIDRKTQYQQQQMQQAAAAQGKGVRASS